MKVNMETCDNIIVFLNNYNIKDIDFENKDAIETHFRKLFLKLKYVYNIDIKGYYDIDIYIDNIYGAILNLEHENIEYFDYFENKIDMRVNVISNTKFLYQVEDILDIDKSVLENSKIYLFKSKYYLLLKNALPSHVLGHLIEMGDIIYGTLASDILKLGKTIELKHLV